MRGFLAAAATKSLRLRPESSAARCTSLSAFGVMRASMRAEREGLGGMMVSLYGGLPDKVENSR